MRPLKKTRRISFSDKGRGSFLTKVSSSSTGMLINHQKQFDKYICLAKESLSIGDRVMAEYHYQYADHYKRLINAQEDSRAQMAKDTIPPEILKNSDSAHEITGGEISKDDQP